MSATGPLSQKPVLHLTGAYGDRAAMGAVRDLLASHAIDSIVTPWIKGGGNANPTLDRQRPPPIAVCWSSTSASLDYPRLHALARRLQQDDRYLGISLDGTVAPAGLDARSLPDLNTMLATRGQDALSTLWPGPAGAIDWLSRLAVGARIWWHWLVAVPVVALVVVLLEFGLNYANSVENVCKFSILREPCRYLEASGVPTREEDQDWNRAAAGKACKPFNDYLEGRVREQGLGRRRGRRPQTLALCERRGGHRATVAQRTSARRQLRPFQFGEEGALHYSRGSEMATCRKANDIRQIGEPTFPSQRWRF
ncbi:MAG: hypothetical protein ABW128_16630 [Rhizorhabdus sp.]